ncbi:hypothetical protein D0862_04551 [Hortaea werneckii]|uniref:Autophagy-related protein 28 n=1 Tax=Hortaea werneckii TaxID=91943 RepID=A0A3M7H035_HORWE|nr:hypothetical protein D0862_04551 [Hortaea werneckii]
MDRSWSPRASASQRGLLFDQDRDHELPRWRTPSPMSSSMIPPPIVQSTIKSTSPKAAQKSVILEKPSPLQDRQTELEADLQFLLDAQAEGLAAGLDGGSTGDENVSTGSTTPTALSVRSRSAKRGSRTIRKRPGLRSARKGIYNSILALSAVKEDEIRDVDLDVQEKEDALHRMDEWDQKRVGLQNATRRTDDSEETIRAQRLRQEADVLQQDINQVEIQLADMKGRHNKLMRQVQQAENSVQAKLASYTTSMNLLEKDIQKFLSLKPSRGQSEAYSRDVGQSMWELPAERRTLEMARGQYTDERDAVLHQRQGVEREKSALDEGAAVWKDVMLQVTEFEKRLRSEMASLPVLTSMSAWEDPPQADEERMKAERTKDLLKHLETKIELLDAHFKRAEEEHWSLLIAAIGAELDALRQGRQILRNILDISDDDTLDGNDASATGDLLRPQRDTDGAAQGQEKDGEDGREIAELDKSFETARPITQRIAEVERESDEDPDPELLFSKPKVDGNDDPSDD